MISIIAAIGKNGELGANNALLWNLPIDMQHFRNYTMGKSIIMGHNTYMSIGKPLPKRTNVVITRDDIPNVIIAHDIYDAINAGLLNSNEAVIVGGAKIYKQTLPLADKLLITHIERDFPHADVYFPDLDFSAWNVIKTTDFYDSGVSIRINEYLRP